MNDSKFIDYVDWNSFHSSKFKLFYVATPKVACTSIKWWLAELEGYSEAVRAFKNSAETDPDLVIHDGFAHVAPHIAGVTEEQLLLLSRDPSYFRFAVVRNPYKRIFSAWQSKLLLQEPLQVSPYLECSFLHQTIHDKKDIALAFEGFLEHLQTYETPNFWDCHWTPQQDLLRPDIFNYSMVCRIENAQQLSEALAKHMGSNYVDPFAIRRTNESLIPYLEEFITPRSAELIRSLYAKDFEAFDYPLDTPKAKECFSEEQLQLAMRGIEIIRGRHQRFAEIREAHAEQMALMQKNLDWLAGEREAWMTMAHEKEAEVYALLKTQVNPSPSAQKP